MAKVVIAGDAVVITSAMKLEDLKTISKYRPEALILKGGEDNKEPVFAISITNGVGEINKYGATFGSATHDDDKFATITMGASGVEEDIKEYVADQIGTAVVNLNKLENTLPEVLKDIKDEKEVILSNITIA